MTRTASCFWGHGMTRAGSREMWASSGAAETASRGCTLTGWGGAGGWSPAHRVTSSPSRGSGTGAGWRAPPAESAPTPRWPSAGSHGAVSTALPGSLRWRGSGCSGSKWPGWGPTLGAWPGACAGPGERAEAGWPGLWSQRLERWRGRSWPSSTRTWGEVMRSRDHHLRPLPGLLWWVSTHRVWRCLWCLAPWVTWPCPQRVWPLLTGGWPRRLSREVTVSRPPPVWASGLWWGTPTKRPQSEWRPAQWRGAGRASSQWGGSPRARWWHSIMGWGCPTYRGKRRTGTALATRSSSTLTTQAGSGWTCRGSWYTWTTTAPPSATRWTTASTTTALNGSSPTRYTGWSPALWRPGTCRRGRSSTSITAMTLTTVPPGTGRPWTTIWETTLTLTSAKWPILLDWLKLKVRLYFII